MESSSKLGCSQVRALGWRGYYETQYQFEIQFTPTLWLVDIFRWNFFFFSTGINHRLTLLSLPPQFPTQTSNHFHLPVGLAAPKISRPWWGTPKPIEETNSASENCPGQKSLAASRYLSNNRKIRSEGRWKGETTTGLMAGESIVALMSSGERIRFIGQRRSRRRPLTRAFARITRPSSQQGVRRKGVGAFS